MATRTLKAKIALEGEQQYKSALSELNKGNQVLASEMRKLTAEYKGNTESTEYLTKKGEVLEKQLLQQKDKVQTLREALANAAEKYGESSEKTQEWQVKLNNAEAAEAELQHAIDENTQQLDTQDNVMAKLSGTVEGVADKLGVKLPQGAKSALDAMKTMGNGSVLAIGAIGAAVTGAIAAIKKLSEITLQAASDADELITKSMTSGVGTDTLQKWQYASELIDVSVDTMTGSLTKLTKSMSSAKDGNKAAAEAFAELGVSITDSDGHLRDSEAVFYDVIDALGQMENDTERDAMAMEILGKSAQELNPLILQGSDALRQLGEEAEATGYVLDESQVKKLAEVDDSYQKMQLQIEATKKELAVQFAPAAKAAMDLFSDVVKKAAKVLVDSGIIEGVAAIVESLKNMISKGDTLNNSTVPTMGQKFSLLQASLGAVAQTMALIADAANLITGIVTLDWSKVKTSLGFGYSSGNASNYQRVVMQQDGRWNQYNSYYNPTNPYADSSLYGYDASTGLYYNKQTGNYMYGHNASGNDNWRGGLTWVGEAGPELVALPRGTQILTAQESRELGGDVFNITIDAASVREFNDIVELARSARVRRRMEG